MNKIILMDFLESDKGECITKFEFQAMLYFLTDYILEYSDSNSVRDLFERIQRKLLISEISDNSLQEILKIIIFASMKKTDGLIINCTLYSEVYNEIIKQEKSYKELVNLTKKFISSIMK